jgi:hypothetical protein
VNRIEISWNQIDLFTQFLIVLFEFWPWILTISINLSVNLIVYGSERCPWRK